MRKLILILLLIYSFPIFAQNEEWKKTITPENAQSAIALFKADPLGKDADGALSIVVNFAEHSDRIIVEISEKTLPWKMGSLGNKLDQKLLGAFIAGNVECQLKKNIKENCPIEGIQLTLSTYQALKKAKKIMRQEKFEKWIELDKKNALTNLF